MIEKLWASCFIKQIFHTTSSFPVVKLLLAEVIVAPPG